MTGIRKCCFSPSGDIELSASIAVATGVQAQVADGHDMDHYAADAAAVVDHLALRDAVHIGHSTGGGEVARYVATQGKGRVDKAVLMSAVPPIMVKSPNNPDGTPLAVFDGLRASLAANRAQFYRDIASGPFYGFNRPGAKPMEGIIANWWRQGMMGAANAHYQGIKAFSETDFTEDLKAIAVPTLVLHGDDDQIGTIQGRRSALREAPQACHAEDLSRIPARHAHHSGRCDQRGAPGLHQGMSLRADQRATSSTGLRRQRPRLIRINQRSSPCPHALRIPCHDAASHMLRRRCRLRRQPWLVKACRGLCRSPQYRRRDTRRGGNNAIQIHKLRGNVSVIEGSGGNIAVLTGKDGKLFVDAGITATRPRILKAVESLSPDPIKHLINTHWHFDHTDGNQWLNEEGAEILAHENTHKHLLSAQRVDDWNYRFPSPPLAAVPTQVFSTEKSISINGSTLASEILRSRAYGWRHLGQFYRGRYSPLR